VVVFCHIHVVSHVCRHALCRQLADVRVARANLQAQEVAQPDALYQRQKDSGITRLALELGQIPTWIQAVYNALQPSVHGVGPAQKRRPKLLQKMLPPGRMDSEQVGRVISALL